MNCVEPIRDRETIIDMRKVLKQKSIRNELMFILGINTGLRISDIIKLRIKDLINEDKSFKNEIELVEQKTKKDTRLPLNKMIHSSLLELFEEEPDIQMDDYLFKSRKGHNLPITRQQAYRILNNAAEHIGLVERDSDGLIVNGEIGTHTLRKTFGYHAYQNGVTLPVLMKIFNHSSQSQTLRYIGLQDVEIKDVYYNSNLG